VRWRQRVGIVVRDVEGLLSTAVVVALRRARDLADAIEARGGLSVPTTTSAPPGAIDAVVRCLSDPDPLVRGHAVWAAARLGRADLTVGLDTTERDPGVRAELEGRAAVRARV